MNKTYTIQKATGELVYASNSFTKVYNIVRDSFPKDSVISAPKVQEDIESNFKRSVTKLGSAQLTEFTADWGYTPKEDYLIKAW